MVNKNNLHCIIKQWVLITGFLPLDGTHYIQQLILITYYTVLAVYGRICIQQWVLTTMVIEQIIISIVSSMGAHYNDKHQPMLITAW